MCITLFIATLRDQQIDQSKQVVILAYLSVSLIIISSDQDRFGFDIMYIGLIQFLEQMFMSNTTSFEAKKIGKM